MPFFTVSYHIHYRIRDWYVVRCRSVKVSAVGTTRKMDPTCREGSYDEWPNEHGWWSFQRAVHERPLQTQPGLRRLLFQLRRRGFETIAFRHTVVRPLLRERPPVPLDGTTKASAGPRLQPSQLSDDERQLPAAASGSKLLQTHLNVTGIRTILI